MQPPRGPALWLRRARELFSDLQSHAHARATATTGPSTSTRHQPPAFRPPDWLRPPWDPPPEYPPVPAPTRRAREEWSRSAFRAPPPPHHHHSPRVGAAAGTPNPACDVPDCATPAESVAALAQAMGAVRTEDEGEAGMQMRNVLRSVAQPVVVAVARTSSETTPFHGATLTSFASLTLEPHPLVAFSLRLPSRMADCLRPPPPLPTAGEPVPAHLCSPRAPPTRLTISLLAAANQGVANELARPGTDHSAIFQSAEWDTRDPPALRSAVGCLECQVVHSLPLRDVGGETSSDNQGSELFICRVLKAEKGDGCDSLVHFQRDYFSVNREGTE